MDWSEIVSKYNMTCNGDTVRKASQTPFGGKFISDYLAIKNCKSDSTLKKAKDIVGEQYLVKQQIRNEKNQINKVKKDFVKSLSIAEELEQIQIDNNFTVNVPSSCLSKEISISDNEMILHISDWHIGYVINNCNGNSFNWDVANKRIDQLISEVYKYIDLFDIKKVYVINTGDVIEHTYMRKNQSQFCEFSQSEQINKAIELIFRLLVSIVEIPNIEVIYDSVVGNHDRSQGEISVNNDGDNAETIINRQLATYTRLAKMTRLHIVDRKHTEKDIAITVNGLSVKARHGHDIVKDEKRQLKNDISMDEEFYDLLLIGHLHNHRVISENNGRYIVGASCLSGFNDYSKQFGCTTIASQNIIIVAPNRVELIKDVQLN